MGFCSSNHSYAIPNFATLPKNSIDPATGLPSEFVTDCVVWAAFSAKNNCAALRNVEYQGRTWQIQNNLYPFLLEEVRRWPCAHGDIAAQMASANEDRFLAKWLNSFSTGLTRLTGLSGGIPQAPNPVNPVNPVKNKLSPEARAVLDAARALYREFYANITRTPWMDWKIETWDAGWHQIRNAMKSLGGVALPRDRGGRAGARPSRRGVARRPQRPSRQAPAADLLARLSQSGCGVLQMKRNCDTMPVPQGGDEIVVYQPNDELRIDVRVEDKTVWLNQLQLSELFGVTVPTVNYHIKEVLNCGELAAEATIRKILIVRAEGARTVRRPVDFYNLDMIISVGYRVNSKRGVQFRQWATRVLTDHLLRGYTVNSRINQLEDRTDCRLLEHDRRIESLESKVDFFVKTQTPPLQGVFYNGQLWDARAFATQLVRRAKRSILIIDSWVDAETLDVLAKKGAGVSAEIVTSRRGNKIAASDVAKFTAQYGALTVRVSRNFHDRFLVLDDRELYLIGASLKDLGLKCFGFTRMDSKEIPVLKGRI